MSGIFLSSNIHSGSTKYLVFLLIVYLFLLLSLSLHSVWTPGLGSVACEFFGGMSNPQRMLQLLVGKTT